MFRKFYLDSLGLRVSYVWKLECLLLKFSFRTVPYERNSSCREYFHEYSKVKFNAFNEKINDNSFPNRMVGEESIMMENARIARHRVLFEKLAKNAGFSALKDWYRVAFGDSFRRGKRKKPKGLSQFSDKPSDIGLMKNDSEDIQPVCSAEQRLLESVLKRYYGNSLSIALHSLYPNHQWHSWPFTRDPRVHRSSNVHQRRLLDAIGPTLGVCHPRDWYRVRYTEVRKLARPLLARHGYSLMATLTALYPEYHWESWRLTHKPRRSTSFANVGNDWDWSLSKTHVLNDLWSMPLIPMAFADFSYNRSKRLDALRIETASKSQYFLFCLVRSLFQEYLSVQETEDLFINLRKPLLLNSTTKQPLELDIFVSSLSLAFEYNGAQHYYWNFRLGSPHSQRNRDQEKRENCMRSGITLIEVPFWWDQRPESIIQCIHNCRPDLLQSFQKQYRGFQHLSRYMPSKEFIDPFPLKQSSWYAYTNRQRSGLIQLGDLC